MLEMCRLVQPTWGTMKRNADAPWLEMRPAWAVDLVSVHLLLMQLSCSQAYF